MVEDHPLEYAKFEGTIPKGNYGAGSVMLWDRGWWEPAVAKSPEEMLEKGDFKFILHGEKLRGEFVLAHMKGARGKGNEWLLIKKKDAEARPGWDVEQYAYSAATGRTQEEIAQELPARGPAARKAREAPEGAVPSPMPSSIQPMLAISAAEPASGRRWLYEEVDRCPRFVLLSRAGCGSRPEGRIETAVSEPGSCRSMWRWNRRF
jgi:bifunctional non-homologous end joining protein LigD